MFLTILSESEKHAFLGLAINLIVADSKIENSERKLVSDYCNEMELRMPDKFEKSDEASIIAIFNNSTVAVKKAVYIELYALANIDGNYDENEQKLLSNLANSFKFDEQTVSKIEQSLKKYYEVYNQLAEVVLK